MLADLDLLLTAVFVTADDLLPDQAENARRTVTDAEVVTLAVAQRRGRPSAAPAVGDVDQQDADAAGADPGSAVEYGLLERNAANGRSRRLKAPKYRGTFLDTADAIAALLEGAGTTDALGRTAPYRRALLARLVFAGLRSDEALSLRWRDVDLPSRRLRVARSKSDAGHRVVDLLPALVDELVTVRAHTGGAPDELVFPTSSGGEQSPSNVRNRLIVRAAEKANAALEEAGWPPLPEPLSPHSLRRTFVSVL